MQESYSEDLASHAGPESCVSARKDRGEALTGGSAGELLSREIRRVRGADAVSKSGRQHLLSCQGERQSSHARSQTLSMHGHTSRENREILWPPARHGVTGRGGKSEDLSLQ